MFSGPKVWIDVPRSLKEIFFQKAIQQKIEGAPFEHLYVGFPVNSLPIIPLQTIFLPLYSSTKLPLPTIFLLHCPCPDSPPNSPLSHFPFSNSPTLTPHRKFPCGQFPIPLIIKKGTLINSIPNPREMLVGELDGQPFVKSNKVPQQTCHMRFIYILMCYVIILFLKPYFFILFKLFHFFFIFLYNNKT